ncbi:MAG: Do family serine endopeptidase [Spirochaetes bacterium]|nr:Do family serine endopeptidase [Spirochaetota bacterium]
MTNKNASKIILILLGWFLLFLIAGCKSAQTGSAEQTTDADANKPIFTSSNFQLIGDLQNKLHTIADNETSSVVYISTEKTVKQQYNQVNPFDFFFGQPRSNEPRELEYKQQGLGSGFIYSKKGKKYFILTNDHVVSGMDTITITIGDENYKGKVVGADPAVDIAVVSIETKDELDVGRVGTSENLKIGDFVIAIGNPFGLSHTMTFGIISALGRSNLNTGNRASLTDFIQTDAAINPGNSGGPLINIEGEVIGINTMIFSQTGGNVGIGFAIPIDMAKSVADQIIETGKSQHGWLGIYFRNMNEEDLEKMGIKNTKYGILVQQVIKNGPAEKAGLKAGDILIELNDKELKEQRDLVMTIANTAPGKKVSLKLIRDNKEMKISVVLGDRPNISELSQDEPIRNEETEVLDKYGMEVVEIDNNIRKQYNLPSTLAGVVVTKVSANSLAANADLKPGDVIYKVNNKSISSMKELLDIVKKLDDSAYFFIYREGDQFIVMM